MHPTHDDDRPLTEADRTSETRFGPRPVPPGHHGPRPSVQARRVIASGKVSPDGRSSFPTPSLGAKIAVWGGIAVGVAGGTAAAVLAVRKIADAVSGDSYASHHRRKFQAPRFVEMDEHEREAMRRRVRAQEHADHQEVSRLRAEASQHRPAQKPKASKPKGNFVEDLIHTSTKLSESLEGVAKSLSMAMDGFRSVARQATEVVAEFADTADQLRAALRGERPRSAQRDPGDSDRAHRL
ncbi:hypothetical protein ACFOM8_00080 [Paracoccus angustae]|uniref:YtxH domain-containing protein n=1 Tax=Paracoccus angustae TaxID=1671480 RepID=A0ABV7TYL6_9RHOB